LPKVTVGMPLYNNAKTIKESIESVLSQSEADLELLISDDGSNDETVKICQEFAQRDPRIKVYVQPKNLYYLNFKFLVDKANTDYFCWLAGDDKLHPDFIKLCISKLESDLQIVSCASHCLFNQSGREFLANGTYKITDNNISNRLCAYFKSPKDNTRMYGVFRTTVLKKSFPEEIFHAFDWALSALTLCYGGHDEINEIKMFRDKTPTENYKKLSKTDHNGGILTYFPVFKMSLFLLKQKVFPKTPKVLFALFKLNVKQTLRQISR